jgi:hypothetical protein
MSGDGLEDGAAEVIQTNGEDCCRSGLRGGHVGRAGVGGANRLMRLRQGGWRASLSIGEISQSRLDVDGDAHVSSMPSPFSWLR